MTENFSRVFHRHLLNSNTRWLTVEARRHRDLFTHQLQALFGKWCCQNVDDQHMCCHPHTPKALIALLVLPKAGTHFSSECVMGLTGSFCRGFQGWLLSLNLLCFFFRHLWGQASQAVPDSEFWPTSLVSKWRLPHRDWDVINTRTPPLGLQLQKLDMLALFFMLLPNLCVGFMGNAFLHSSSQAAPRNLQLESYVEGHVSVWSAHQTALVTHSLH